MNKVALVTGATGYIGRSIVLEFAKSGYNVVINYYQNKEGAIKLVQEVKSLGVDAIDIKCDISNEKEVKDMFQEVKNYFGRLDALVNNASISNDSILLDKTKEDFLKVYEVNLVGTFLCSKYAASLMNEKSSIVNISSTNALDTFYTYSCDYDASKAAIISLSNNLAVELAPIRVNTVAPGWVSNMYEKLDKNFIKKEEEKILLMRFAQPDEIANTVIFLCSDKASYINQSVIRIDGGSYK